MRRFETEAELLAEHRERRLYFCFVLRRFETEAELLAEYRRECELVRGGLQGELSKARRCAI